MKNLKDCIKNYVKDCVKDHINESYLNESVWDIEDNIEDDNEESIKKSIYDFLDKNFYIIGRTDLRTPSKYIKLELINNQIVINTPYSIYCDSKIKKFTNGLFEWGEVGGHFICGNCCELKTLEGAPKIVKGNFSCGHCKKLTSLEGAPEKVYGNFNCSYCEKLTTLEGAPKEVDGNFDCYSCNNLTSLKGAPKIVKGSFDCHPLERPSKYRK